MLDRYIVFITLTVRDHYVEYSSFAQKFVEFDLICFQLNYKRIVRLEMSVVSFQMTMIHFRN